MTTEKRISAVIVCSDRAFEGHYEDKSGPAAVEWLAEHNFNNLSLDVIPDDVKRLQLAVAELATNADVLIVSGGTGLGPRDTSPQSIAAIADYEIPGFGELLRKESLKYSFNAYLSRCGAFVVMRKLVLVLPGNPKAVVEQLDIVADLLPHAISALRGECKHRRKREPQEAVATL